MNTRNFHFLMPPRPEDRLGRYVAGTDLLIGGPVEAGNAIDGNGQRTLTLRTSPVTPKKGKHGILVYENPTADTPGFDPMLTSPWDLDKAPAGRSVQLVSASYVRFRLRNTADELFEGQRDYPARTMIAGLGATPSLGIDDYIGPGTGTDVAGYWAEADQAHAWAIVVAVYDTGEVDAQMLF